MPKGKVQPYSPAPCVLRTRQRDEDVINTLRRARRHRRTLIGEHVCEAWSISPEHLLRLARRADLLDALDDRRALTGKNFPGLDTAPLGVQPT